MPTGRRATATIATPMELRTRAGLTPGGAFTVNSGDGDISMWYRSIHRCPHVSTSNNEPRGVRPKRSNRNSDPARSPYRCWLRT